MKRNLILVFFVLIVCLDFFFFDYSVGELGKGKNISKFNTIDEVKGRIEYNLPFIFKDSNIKLQSCKEYRRNKPKANNAFEKEAIRTMDKNCTLLKILKHVKIPPKPTGKKAKKKIDVHGGISLKDINIWDKNLVFECSCGEVKNNYDNILSKYSDITDMVDDGIIDITPINSQDIIVNNTILRRTCRIKNLFKVNFNDRLFNKDCNVIEVSVADVDDNYVECVKYLTFKHDDKTGIMVKN